MASDEAHPYEEPGFTDPETAVGDTAETEDDTEVVAHAADSEEELPWCVGYFC
jgi:hypothetical protein